MASIPNAAWSKRVSEMHAQLSRTIVLLVGALGLLPARAEVPVTLFDNRTHETIHFESATHRYELQSGDRRMLRFQGRMKVEYQDRATRYAATLDAGGVYYFERTQGKLALFEQKIPKVDLVASEKFYRLFRESMLKQATDLQVEYQSATHYRDCMNQNRAVRLFTDSCGESLPVCMDTFHRQVEWIVEFKQIMAGYREVLATASKDPRRSFAERVSLLQRLARFDEADEVNRDGGETQTSLAAWMKASTQEQVTECAKAMKQGADFIRAYPLF
jgi:hypothetical protein